MSQFAVTDQVMTNRTLTVISEISNVLVQTKSTQELLQHVLDKMRQHFSIAHAYMLLPIEDQQLKIIAALGAAEEQIGQTVSIGIGIAGIAAQRRRPICIGNMKMNRRYVRSLMSSSHTKSSIIELPGLPHADSQIAIPLIVGDELAGILVAESLDSVVFSKEDADIFSLITSQIAASVLMIQNHEKLERMRQQEEGLRQKTQHTLQELKKTQNLLIQRERLATLGQLITGIAHEVNTPLGAIIASVSQIPQQLPDIFESLNQYHFQISDELWSSLIQLILAPSSNIPIGSLEALNAYDDLLNLLKLHQFEDADDLSDLLSEVGVFADHPCLLATLDAQVNSKQLRLVYKARAISDATDTIKTAAYKANEVIKALKSFIHQDIMNPEEVYPINIHQNIEHIITLYQNMLKHGIKVNRQFTSSPVVVLGHAEQLSQVWTNIIHNAIHAMEGYGILSLSSDIDQDKVRIYIKNNGPKISEDLKKRIFEPFFTTKKLGQGTGLGLHLCCKIIHAHQGEITLSEEDDFTCFIITLPLYHEA